MSVGARYSRCLLALLSFFAIATAQLRWLQAAPTTAPAVFAQPRSSDFLRLIDKGSTGNRLETADVAYRNAEGVTVYLVSAVHVGEREYFEGLNESFKLRDAVLYEMVKPKDVPAPLPGEKPETQSMISQAQRLMKDVLGLEFQLDVVDYSPANFLHADLDAETFQKMQAERGESFTSMFLQAMMKAMTQPPADNGDAPAHDMEKMLEDMVKTFTRPDMERQLKLRLARQLVDMENQPFGPNALEGTVLLTERNKAAVVALDRALLDGKKDIAIFYGAAHMPDLAERLQQRGFTRVATQWRMAWNLTIRPDEPYNTVAAIVSGGGEIVSVESVEGGSLR